MTIVIENNDGTSIRRIVLDDKESDLLLCGCVMLGNNRESSIGMDSCESECEQLVEKLKSVGMDRLQKERKEASRKAEEERQIRYFEEMNIEGIEDE